jgi:hypothetical protein
VYLFNPLLPPTVRAANSALPSVNHAVSRCSYASWLGGIRKIVRQSKPRALRASAPSASSSRRGSLPEG